MTRGRAAAIGFTAALAAGVPAADEPDKPRELGLTERTSTRLAQLDVTLSGPKDATHGLGVADFEVRLNDKLVSGLIVDDLCMPASGPSPAPPADSESAVNVATPPPARGSIVSYLLYFDMPHLTQGGRRDSIDAARLMLPKLLAGGNRAMLVANARELKTLVPLTDDIKKLDAALAKLINDVTLFDSYAATESTRLAEITREMSINHGLAVSMAMHYALDERFRQERDLRRLSMVLGRFYDVDPPKAALYFSDTMRQNAGEHYLTLFSGSTLKGWKAVAVENAAATGALPLDDVMNQASSYGVRFYTVEGQGLTSPDTMITTMSSPYRVGNEPRAKPGQLAGQGNQSTANQAQPTVYTQRTYDAQETLNSLAAETGGRSFINGVPPAKMATAINDDMSCLYLLSFDPKGFKQDTPLAVSVLVKRPKVKTSVRGRLVIQGEESRLTARVLSAFATAREGNGTGPIRAGIVPVSYSGGHFKARVQVAVPGSVVPDATWDLAASLVTQGVVGQDASGRVEVQQAGVPVAFERDMEFAPGEFELVVVGHEITTDTLLSHQATGSFPDIDLDRAAIAPIAVSQQAHGGFLRKGASLTQGAIVVPEGEPLQPGAPTAIIALVCRAKDQKGTLRITRTLVGETETPVGSTDLDLEKGERCGQIVDLIPTKFLGPGSYRFTIAVSAQGTELARAERALVVSDPPSAGGS